MVVYRSPFKTQYPKPTPVSGTRSTPSLTANTYESTLELKPSSNTSTSSSKKTSFDDEKEKLQKSIDSVAKRIDTAGNQGQYNKILAELNKVGAGGKTKNWTDNKLVGFLKNTVLDTALGPIYSASKNPITKNALSLPSRTVQSAVDYAFAQPATNLTNLALAKITGNDDFKENVEWTSFGKMLERSNDPEWSLKKEKRYQTGAKWFDTATGFGIDVIADPLTYTGVGELQWAGRAGRSALALKFGETEMLKRYPQMAGKLDDVVRYGTSAIPKEIRDAEGITNGLRFAGRIVPETEGIAGALIAPVTGARTGIGDLLYKTTKGRAVQQLVTPASRLQGVIGGVGYRGANLPILSDKRVLEAISGTSADRYAKAKATGSHGDWILKAKPLIDAAREAGVLDDVANLVESEVDRAAASPQARALAESFIEWQNQVRGEVSEAYAKFGLKYGVDTKEVGFVENYIHHKLTKDARKWVLGKGKGRAGTWYQTKDLTVNDLTGAIGAVRHRKLGPGEEFMGETLKTGTIKEINEISMRNAGVKWFDTDLGSIADAYSYSMSKTLGREAWARRMMDFGPDFIKPMIKKTVPDKVLQRDLGIVYAKLIDASLTLRNNVSIGGKTIASYGRRSTKLAEQVLTKQGREVTRNAAEIKKVQTLLNQAEVELVKSYEVAGTKTVAERGAYADAHKALYSFQRRLSAALQGSEDGHGAAVQVLKEHYAELFPDARSIPDNPERLAEAILRKNKISVAKETKHIEQRMADLSAQIDEMPTTAEFEETRSFLMDELNILQDHVDGVATLTDVRLNASYSPDGFVYGYVDDFGPLPEGVAPYRRLTTYKPDNTFPTNPKAVAMHAPDERSLIDLRNGDDFRYVFGNENMPRILGSSLTNAGLDGATFEQQALSYWSGNELDPLFIDINPEQAQLIELIGDFAKLPHDQLDEDAIVMAFDALDDQLRHVASAVGDYGETDMVAQQMLDDILGGTIATSDYTGMVIPSVVSNNPHPDLVGKFDVLMDTQWSDNVPKAGWSNATDPVQRVADSSLVQRILGSDYETVSLDTQQRIGDVAENLMGTELSAGQREALAAQKRSLAGQKGAATKAGNRTVKATEQAMEQYEKSKTITVVINGKRTTLTREQGLKMLVDVDKQVAKQEAALEKVIKQIESDAGLPQLLKKQATYQERLPMLFNQAEVLQRWTDEVGLKLQAEVDNMKEILNQKPSKKAAAMQTGAWAKKVDASIKTMDNLPPVEAEAYARVVTQLHADEAKMAMLTYNKLPATLMEIEAVKQGFLGTPTFQLQVQKGWEAIAALGVQVPKELLSQWGPNIAKLQDNAVLKAFENPYRYYTRLFKTYAIASPGFAVRNAMSATFMNFVAGVELKNITEGARMSWAIQKHGPQWLEKMNIEPALQASYKKAWDATRVTSRGFGDSLAEPVVGGGFAERVINNKVTRGFGKLNEFTERAMRLPMALDSTLRGHSLDQTINRINMYHFDYTDLSTLDRFMHNIVPFWIWTSRNLPLQIASQWSRPSAYLTYDKLLQAYPVDEDIFLPSWMKPIRPLGITGNLVLAPDMPQARLKQTLEMMNPLNAKFIGQLNPAIKVPIELFQLNKQAALDIPFNQDRTVEAKGLDAAIAWVGEKTGIEPLGGRDPETGKLMVTPKAQYFAGAVLPPVATAQRLSGGLLGGKESYKERTLSSWANWLGGPAREIGPDQQRSEAISRQFEVKDFAKMLEKRGQLKEK